METILNEVNDIFIDVLGDEGLKLQREYTANDVDDWDSLNHIHLVVAMEKHFKIRFSSQEIQSWENVGDIIDCIKSKTE